MIQGFAIAATVIALLISVGAGFASYSAGKSQGGGDFGDVLGGVMSAFLAFISFVAGVLGFIGIIACVFGRSQ